MLTAPTLARITSPDDTVLVDWTPLHIEVKDGRWRGLFPRPPGIDALDDGDLVRLETSDGRAGNVRVIGSAPGDDGRPMIIFENDGPIE